MKISGFMVLMAFTGSTAAGMAWGPAVGLFTLSMLGLLFTILEEYPHASPQ